VKVKFPPTVGVPLTAPVELFNASPGGNVPAVKENV
jgi:hypothetical protein